MTEETFIVKKDFGLGTLRDAALAIRQDVFVTEQNVPLALELDDLDDETTHYVGFVGDQAVATARVAVNPATNNWHIQRVATDRQFRGHGYAAKVMQTIIADARANHAKTLDLGAQITALGFYEKLGFIGEGEIFMDAGIQHRNMILILK